MVILTIRVPFDLRSKLTVISARRATTVSELCRRMIEDGCGKLIDQSSAQKEPFTGITKEALEYILIGCEASKELAVHILDGREDRQAILDKIEARVIAKVAEVFGEKQDSPPEKPGHK